MLDVVRVVCFDIPRPSAKGYDNGSSWPIVEQTTISALPSLSGKYPRTKSLLWRNRVRSLLCGAQKNCKTRTVYVEKCSHLLYFTASSARRKLLFRPRTPLFS